jgi:S-adenosyl-L-methionine hydrolase (adenosine-forming)
MSVVTLLTDFGAASPYPAEVRGVLAARSRARLIDIAHDVPAHDIRAGAYVLAAAAPTFPVGTVHLAVVDPTVGTPRRAIAVAAGGHIFVGPDNGLLMRASASAGRYHAFAIDAERFMMPAASATFHGRDLFAPVAAALAGGLPIERAGEAVDDPMALPERTPRRGSTRIAGAVVYQDRFGNLVTNIPAAWLADLTVAAVAVGRRRVRARRGRTYADGSRGEVLVLVGSGAETEIAVYGGSAAKRLGLAPGDAIALETSREGRSRRPLR